MIIIPKKPKYKIGEKVYSYQNRNKPYPINYIRESNDPNYPHNYRLSLPNGNSNWISENSIAKTKNAKKLDK